MPRFITLSLSLPLMVLVLLYPSEARATCGLGYTSYFIDNDEDGFGTGNEQCLTTPPEEGSYPGLFMFRG
jgi:hypothetical protein